MPRDILTDMKKILVLLDDETANLLDGKKNKSKFIREAIKYISMDISTDTLDGMRQSYALVAKRLKEIDSKLDYLTGPVISDAGLQGPIQPTEIATIPKPFVPKAPDPVTGYPCCTKKVPCKHWAFNTETSIWTNELTGETKEVVT